MINLKTSNDYFRKMSYQDKMCSLTSVLLLKLEECDTTLRDSEKQHLVRKWHLTIVCIKIWPATALVCQVRTRLQSYSTEAEKCIVVWKHLLLRNNS